MSVMRFWRTPAPKSSRPNSAAVASLMALDAAVNRERAAREVFVSAVAAASRGNPTIAVALGDLAVALKESSDLFSNDWKRIQADYRELETK